MIQEQKDLLLQDLCARLPYGVKVLTYKLDYFHNPSSVETLYEINKDGYISTVESDTLRHIGKPYLFPLSSMTEEQLFEAQEILGKHEIEIEDGFLCIVDSDRKTISYLEILALLEWFYKNHFDIYGLIQMDLAIDATGLNIY